MNVLSKIILTLFLSASMILQPIMVFAQHDLSKELTVDYIIYELESIHFDRDINFFPIEQDNSIIRDNNTELLNFDTVQEFEIFLEGLILSLNEPDQFNIYIEETNEIGEEHNLTISHSSKSRTETETWYGGSSPWGGLFHNRHISYTYTVNNNGGPTSATVRDSWITGVSGLSWTHRHGNTNVWTNIKAMQLDATGTWLLGVSINGFDIGASWNDTWTRFIYL